MSAQQEAKREVTRYCRGQKLDLINPSKAAPEIIIMQQVNGFSKVIAEGRRWTDIHTQLVAWQRKEYNL